MNIKDIEVGAKYKNSQHPFYTYMGIGKTVEKSGSNDFTKKYLIIIDAPATSTSIGSIVHRRNNNSSNLKFWKTFYKIK